MARSLMSRRVVKRALIVSAAAVVGFGCGSAVDVDNAFDLHSSAITPPSASSISPDFAGLDSMSEDNSGDLLSTMSDQQTTSQPATSQPTTTEPTTTTSTAAPLATTRPTTTPPTTTITIEQSAPPQVFEFVIPAGTAARIASGANVDDVLPSAPVFRVGDSIQITNEDSQPHFYGPIALRSTETVRWKFQSPGEFSGQCTVSSDRTVVLTVVER